MSINTMPAPHDLRDVAILAKLGVMIGAIQATDKPLRWQLPFTCSGDRELAEYYVETFLVDRFNATHCMFFRSPSNPRNLYCQFTPRGQ